MRYRPYQQKLLSHLGYARWWLAHIFFAFIPPFTAGAASADWQVTPLASQPQDIVVETQVRGGGLPDGLVATHTGGDISSAVYVGPTKRYAHGIMGDAIEASVLSVTTNDGREISLELPYSEVFEDRYPRLADLDGDGAVEVITIRSSASAGAAVTIYGLSDGALVQKATTPFIGRSNRWLNIAAIEPFLGGDAKQIAYVTTPHIGGTLKLIGYENGASRQYGDAYGFSNHWIGSRELRLSATMMIDGVLALALPSANRGTLRIMTFAKSGPEQIAAIQLPGRIDKAIGRTPHGFVVGLNVGTVLAVEPSQ